MKVVAVIIIGVIAFYSVWLVRAGLWIRRVARNRNITLGGYDKTILTIGVLGLVVAGYGAWIEPRRVEIVKVSVPLRHVAPQDSVVVVQISDFHSPSNNSLLRRLPDLIKDLHPDVIVFTGDAVNDSSGERTSRATLQRLAEIAPTYGILGNRDAVLQGRDIFAGTGVTELRGAPVPVKIRETRVTMIGASRQADWLKVRGALRSAGDSIVSIYAGHSPDVVNDVSKWGASLVLVGHTHGGQVALPGYGAIWTATRSGKRFEAGLYKVGETWMYVNRGIGMEARLPKIRIGARPEITVLRLGAGTTRH